MLTRRATINDRALQTATSVIKRLDQMNDVRGAGTRRRDRRAYRHNGTDGQKQRSARRRRDKAEEAPRHIDTCWVRMPINNDEGAGERSAPRPKTYVPLSGGGIAEGWGFVKRYPKGFADKPPSRSGAPAAGPQPPAGCARGVGGSGWGLCGLDREGGAQKRGTGRSKRPSPPCPDDSG